MQLVAMIAAVDVDGTGHVDEDEFINIMTRKLRDCRKILANHFFGLGALCDPTMVSMQDLNRSYKMYSTILTEIRMAKYQKGSFPVSQTSWV